MIHSIFRSLTLKSAGESELLGVTGNKYISDEEMFDNGDRVPSRKCYCKDVDCQPSGTLNVSNCKFGAPVFVSLPHFYLADESYTKNLTGMNPKKEDHEFRLVINTVSRNNIVNCSFSNLKITELRNSFFITFIEDWYSIASASCFTS